MGTVNVWQTMCARTKRISQSEIVLPLRKICCYPPLSGVVVFLTEIKKLRMFSCKHDTYAAFLRITVNSDMMEMNFVT